MHTQLAVLGGGPGGYAAAFLAADEGIIVTNPDPMAIQEAFNFIKVCYKI